jgi:ribonuclease G
MRVNKGKRGGRRDNRVLTPLVAQAEREMVVSAEKGETRIAFLEQGRLAEYYYERGQEASIVGSIYKGRVVSVLPGLQAAFVDIGLEKSGFLHVRDVLTESMDIEEYMTAKQARKSDEELPPDEEAAAAASGETVAAEDGAGEGKAADPAPAPGAGRRREPRGRDRFARGARRPIQDLLKKGQEILVQVEKEPISTKGPRLTGQISMPGRQVVLIPGAEHSGVSHRIADEKERDRLKKILDRVTPKGFGAITRTSAEGASEDELKTEIAYLLKLWKSIQAQEKKARAPHLLHGEEGLLHRVVRDVLTKEDRHIIVDSAAEARRIKSWLGTFLEANQPKVEIYQGEVPLFEALNLEAEIEKALRPKVWLKCGGYLIIEETEALVVVDVNTGRNIGKTRQDDTILKTNLEAAQEIARQLRLRDLGGIIVLDFIDMRIEEHKERVYLELATGLQRDRAKTSIRQLTDLGLIEMTRKRVRGSLLRSLSEPCPMCAGRGWVRSQATFRLRLTRMLDRARRLSGENDFILEVSPHARLYLDEGGMREQARSQQIKLRLETQTELKTDELRLVSPATRLVVVGSVTEPA